MPLLRSLILLICSLAFVPSAFAQSSNGEWWRPYIERCHNFKIADCSTAPNPSEWYNTGNDFPVPNSGDVFPDTPEALLRRVGPCYEGIAASRGRGRDVSPHVARTLVIMSLEKLAQCGRCPTRTLWESPAAANPSALENPPLSPRTESNYRCYTDVRAHYRYHLGRQCGFLGPNQPPVQLPTCLETRSACINPRYIETNESNSDCRNLLAAYLDQEESEFQLQLAQPSTSESSSNEHSETPPKGGGLFGFSQALQEAMGQASKAIEELPQVTKEQVRNACELDKPLC